MLQGRDVRVCGNLSRKPDLKSDQSTPKLALWRRQLQSFVPIMTDKGVSDLTQKIGLAAALAFAVSGGAALASGYGYSSSFKLTNEEYKWKYCLLLLSSRTVWQIESTETRVRGAQQKRWIIGWMARVHQSLRT